MTLDTSSFKTTTCTVMRLPSLIGTACRRVRTARPRSGPSARVDGRYRNQTLPAVPTSGQPATPPRFTEKKLESLYLTYHNFSHKKMQITKDRYMANSLSFIKKYLANFCSHDQLNRWNVKSSSNNIILRESRRQEGLYDLTTVPIEQPYDEDRRI
ncbi:hypothetical protein T05_5936 [Trichinella murrelli]|uniref:Uncharacterized protein n=1 Tax=Trichinella murrelli TaxID=144512 RepID=A0A0V0TCN5_9BILA|nr:hypothetical protein T05_5936 [Trichinella murrelli]